MSEDAIDVAWVPGAFEIPLAADKMASSRRYSAVLCLGVVIRGDTTHDQHINRAVSMGIMEVNMKYGVPVLFGVLTCDTVEQAVQRAGGKDAEGAVKEWREAGRRQQRNRMCDGGIGNGGFAEEPAAARQLGGREATHD